MANGIFKPLNGFGSARATDEMSSQSAFSFEWSVKCNGSRFLVGIASQLKRESLDFIINYDQNAIMVSV